MKVALVHDWLTGYRGGERVLHHLARRFPHADLHTLIHEPGRVPAAIEARRIVTSPLDALPGRAAYYRKLLPLFPWAIRRFDFAGYDLVLSTSHAVAKSVDVPGDVPHLSYCFTPMRYVWDLQGDYLGRGPRRLAARPLVRALRRFDVATSGPGSVDRFLAISSEVALRIERHYGREARVVPPPVDVSWIEPATGPGDDYYLLVSSFVPYKRDALVIEAFRRSGRRLVVVGDGPGRARLMREGLPNVEFTGRVDDRTLARLYRDCRALLYPQREDFGLIAVEAQAAGRPVIAYGRGGVLDTVRPVNAVASAGLPAPDHKGDAPEPTGFFFFEQSPEGVARAVEAFERIEHEFAPAALRRWAERFSPARFDAALDDELQTLVPRRPAAGTSESIGSRAGSPARPGWRAA
ncbi:MAG: glycosyltransferase [Spirochaetaceae bacterium]|nr:glycosyltransferase [Myxococcales bacterium]MCB9722871.1 glycosyltransferase [Spirochaetaceae bacterium]